MKKYHTMPSQVKEQCKILFQSDDRRRSNHILTYKKTGNIHTTTCGVSFYHCSWLVVLDTTLCDEVCQRLVTSRWFSPGTPVSSTNKTDCHDITEILLKVALNTITLTPSKLIVWSSKKQTPSPSHSKYYLFPPQYN